MYCSKCGNFEASGLGFCDKCGNKLGDLPVVNSEEINQPVNQNVNQSVNAVSTEGSNNLNNNGIVNNVVLEQHYPQIIPTGNINASVNVNQGGEIPVNSVPLESVNTEITNNSNIHVQNDNVRKTNEKNKWFILGAIILVIVVGIIVYFVFKPKSTANSDNGGSGTRTIMVYMVGTDLESNAGMATVDLEEMIEAKPNLKDNNIVVYAGGTFSWQNEFENNTIYELTGNGFSEVENSSVSSMADPNTLISFLNYVADNYESDLYSLILWNHGGGPIIGYGYDEIYEDLLTTNEIEYALKNNNLTKNEKLEFLGFDACLMSTVEVASSISEYANYLIASQETEPGYGWDYSFLSKVNKDVDTIELGEKIIDSYYDFYDNLMNYYPQYYVGISLSMIDLDKIDTIETEIGTLFTEVEVSLNNGGYSSVVSQMTRAKCFQCEGDDNSYDLIDLYGATEELKYSFNDKASKLLTVLDTAIVYQKTNILGANGLSIYYPYYIKTYLPQFNSVYKDINFSSEYKKFIETYSNALLNNTPNSWDFSRTIPTISSDAGSISVQLDDAVVQNYNRSKYIIFKEMEDNFYSPVYSSNDTTLNSNGTLVSNFNKKELNVVGENGEKGWAISSEYERGTDYVIYKVLVTLSNWDADIDMSEWEKESVYILLRVDNSNPAGKIIGAIPLIDSDDTSTMKKNIDLSKWKYIEFWNYKYKIFDEEGNYTSNWIGAASSGGTITGFEVSTAEKYKLEFVNIDSSANYYCLFIIEDTNGNLHTTNLVKVD